MSTHEGSITRASNASGAQGLGHAAHRHERAPGAPVIPLKLDLGVFEAVPPVGVLDLHEAEATGEKHQDVRGSAAQRVELDDLAARRPEGPDNRGVIAVSLREAASDHGRLAVGSGVSSSRPRC